MSPPPSQPLGRTTGDGASGRPQQQQPLTNEEMRQRRLEALSLQSNSNQKATSSATAATASTGLNLVDAGEDDEDAELQAALALSLQASASGTASPSQQPKPAAAAAAAGASSEAAAKKEHTTATATTNNANTLPVIPTKMIMPTEEETAAEAAVRLQKQAAIYKTLRPFEIGSFHEIMWDSNLTEDSDKSRWVGQGIDVVRTQAQPKQPSDFIDVASDNNNNNNTSMLDKISRDHVPWGLLQQHGGPCGVLAAIQAEMLRILISNTSNANQNQPQYPLLHPELVRHAMAQAIALVLVRATLTPPVYNNNNNPSSSQQQQQSEPHKSIRIVLPVFDPSRMQEATESTTNTTTSTTVPPPPPSLTWNDLEPWSSSSLHSSTAPSPPVYSTCLHVYAVDLDDDTGAAALGDNKTASKRQKTDDSGSGGNGGGAGPPEEVPSNDESNPVLLQLVQTVAQFLLSPPPPPTTTTAAAATATEGGPSSSSSSLPVPWTPLDHFRTPGGVLLLVMSLVASRSVEVMQKEFDDPTGTRLTSQFGHCSQELINLLLTGQAVSNVFDNTLTPSGEMVCYGIQARSSIGYLSQLESLRYVEVGSYYKSPRTPIWVVGSTSHFTVLFGDPDAIQESQSDKLLEQCRRAFKAVEGGGENGFIATDQLAAVFSKLDLNLPDAVVHTLGATLEVTGSGIILWDDFWKTTSRLMTGASVETVLQEQEAGVSTVTNSQGQEVILIDQGGDDIQTTNLPALTESVVPNNETDEEMARRLQREWNDQEGANASSSSTAGMNALSQAAARVASPMDVDGGFGGTAAGAAATSDEELARKLQEEWNADPAGGGMGANSSVGAVDGGSDTAAAAAADDDDDLLGEGLVGGDDGGKSATDQVVVDTVPTDQQHHQQQHTLDFETYGSTFTMYHYNGLRGGVLTPFRITRLTAEEAVGASIALNRGGAGTSGGGGGSGDLEDVLRTKWPSCMINWLGKSPPYID